MDTERDPKKGNEEYPSNLRKARMVSRSFSAGSAVGSVPETRMTRRRRRSLTSELEGEKEREEGEAAAELGIA